MDSLSAVFETLEQVDGFLSQQLTLHVVNGATGLLRPICLCRTGATQRPHSRQPSAQCASYLFHLMMRLESPPFYRVSIVLV